MSWRRQWQPTPVLLPGKSHGQRSLVDYSPWDRKELDTTERHTETNNTITEIKNTLQGINSRIPEAEEQISELEDKMIEITSEEQYKV